MAKLEKKLSNVFRISGNELYQFIRFKIEEEGGELRGLDEGTLVMNFRKGCSIEMLTRDEAGYANRGILEIEWESPVEEDDGEHG